MRLFIKRPGKVAIRLRLPLRVGTGIVVRNVSANVAEREDRATDRKAIKKLTASTLRVLREYIKKYGHFYLVDVRTADGTVVRIKI